MDEVEDAALGPRVLESPFTGSLRSMISLGIRGGIPIY
jgi:hypothetical protein